MSPETRPVGGTKASPVRLGVLGCASVARRRLLPAVAGLPSVRTVATASRSLETAREFGARFGGVAVEGYQALLDRDDVEAVYVPLPTGLHFEWTRRALLAGKHVLCEKPMTTSAAETAELIGLAADRGLVLAENFMFLHHAQHAAVRDLISAGAIGRVRSFGAVFGFPPPPITDIRYRPELGGGALLDVGVYTLRAAQYFLGRRLRVLGACLTEDERHGVDVGGSALLCTPDGVGVQIGFGFRHGYRCQYEIWGSAGRILLDRAFTAPESWRPVVRIERQDHVEERTLPADNQFRNAVDAFATAIRTGRCPETADGDSIVGLAALADQVRLIAARH